MGGHLDRPAVGREGPDSTEYRQGEALGTDPSSWSMGLGKLGGRVSGFRGYGRVAEASSGQELLSSLPPPLAPTHLTRRRCRYLRSCLRTQLRICSVFLSCTHRPAVRAAASLSLGPPRRLSLCGGQALPSPWCPGPSLWGPATVGMGEGLQAAKEAATPHEGLPRLGCPWGSHRREGQSRDTSHFMLHGQVLALRSAV